MFPSANSSVYYNDSGEVLGWDNNYYYEPEYDDYYNDNYVGEAEPYDSDECVQRNLHGTDANMQKDGTWECNWCYEPCDPPYEMDEF